MFPKYLKKLAPFLLAAVATFAGAQEVIPDFYKGPGIDPHRSYVDQSFTEFIDPFNGSLQIHAVDLHVPGNGGFDLQVMRSYNTAPISETNPGIFYGSAGVGWSVHFGRVLYKQPSIGPCAGTSRADVLLDPVLELPDGSTQILAKSATAGATLISTQRWRADCTASGVTVYSPDGVRYDMTQSVNIPSGGPNSLTGYYTTHIVDRNGNYADVVYTGSGSPEVDHITASDGRQINFAYFALASGDATRRISTVTLKDTSGDHVYQYQYQAVPAGYSGYQLQKVIRPDGTFWQYSYFANFNGAKPGSFLMSGVTYPEGGTIAYSYGGSATDYVYFDLAHSAARTTVVKAKTTSDNGNWSFSYAPGSGGANDTTTVNTPSGPIVYTHISPNSAGPGSLWKVGLMITKVTGNSESESYTWSAQVISNQTFNRPGAWQTTQFDPNTSAPVLSSKVINRDGAIYNTSLSNYDPYGNPKTISESGPMAAVVQRACRIFRTLHYGYLGSHKMNSSRVGFKSFEHLTATATFAQSRRTVSSQVTTSIPMGASRMPRFRVDCSIAIPTTGAAFPKRRSSQRG